MFKNENYKIFDFFEKFFSRKTITTFFFRPVFFINFKFFRNFFSFIFYHQRKGLRTIRARYDDIGECWESLTNSQALATKGQLKPNDDKAIIFSSISNLSSNFRFGSWSSCCVSWCYYDSGLCPLLLNLLLLRFFSCSYTYSWASWSPDPSNTCQLFCTWTHTQRSRWICICIVFRPVLFWHSPFFLLILQVEI